MFDDLSKLIAAMQNQYNYICNIWKTKTQTTINLKKKLVSDIKKDNNMLNSIKTYQMFIERYFPRIFFSLDAIEYKNSEIFGRVKTRNSIEYKIDNYCKNHENGKIPIKKCLNDLLGIRIIIDDDFAYSQVCHYIEDNFSEYKYTDSSKNSYTAVHVYFENGNKFFPWELQIWAKKDKQNNILSHNIYKEGYTEWENSKKNGGTING